MCYSLMTRTIANESCEDRADITFGKMTYKLSHPKGNLRIGILHPFTYQNRNCITLWSSGISLWLIRPASLGTINSSPSARDNAPSVAGMREIKCRMLGRVFPKLGESSSHYIPGAIAPEQRKVRGF